MRPNTGDAQRTYGNLSKDLSETERLQFTQDLIKALQDAERTSQNNRKPSCTLAKDAYQKLQFDFPLVSVDELEALTIEYQTSQGSPKLTSKFIQVLREGSEPTVIGQHERQQGQSTSSDPLRLAYQKLYAISLLKTLHTALKASCEQAAVILEQLNLQQDQQQPSLMNDSHIEGRDDTTSTTTAAALPESEQVLEWDITASKLSYLSSQLRYQCLDETSMWRELDLNKLISECLATARNHSHFLQLEPVIESLCSVAHDRIVSSPAELDTLGSIYQALDVVQSPRLHTIEGQVAAKLALQMTASLTKHVTAASAKQNLWKQIKEKSIHLAVAVMQQHESNMKKCKVSSGPAAKSPEQFAAEELDTATFIVRLISFYIVQATPSAATTLGETLIKSGLLRSLVLLFIRHSSTPAVFPVHHALLLIGAAAPESIQWAEAVPGFKPALHHEVFKTDASCRLHAAAWAALKGEDEGDHRLAGELSPCSSSTAKNAIAGESNGVSSSSEASPELTSDTLPSIYMALNVLSEVHAAARTHKPWGTATNAALQRLGLRLRQGMPGAVSVTSSLPTENEAGASSISKQVGENEEEYDARKLRVSPEEQSALLERRQARQLQGECLKLVKGLLQGPGVSSKAD